MELLAVVTILGIIAAINPVTLIIAGIVAAVGLLSAAWAGNWLGIRDIAAAVWEFLKSIFNSWISYLQVLRGLWQNVLLPALHAVWDFLSANIFPVFQTIGGYISGTFQPILNSLGSFLKSTLVPAFAGISKAIETVIGWLKTMADRINSLKLPDWLTPGSPTPWELGLIGINNAMSELNKQLPVMSRGLDKVSLAGASAPGVASQQVSNTSTQNDNFSFYAPVIVQGSTQPQSLGARLKGRRY